MTLDRLNIVMHIVWEEYFNQRSLLNRSSRGRGGGPWNHKYAKDFEKIAKKLIKEDVDPRVYTEMAFKLLYNGGKKFILPKDLLQKDTRAEVLTNLKAETGCEGDVSAIWIGNLEEAEIMMAKSPHLYPDIYSVLLSPNSGFDPWFRVMAVSPFDDKLLDIYGDAAYQEISQSRNLRDFLRKHAPANFKEFENRLGSFGEM